LFLPTVKYKMGPTSGIKITSKIQIILSFCSNLLLRISIKAVNENRRIKKQTKNTRSNPEVLTIVSDLN